MTQTSEEYEVEKESEFAPSGTLAALNRSEIDMQISTAKKYPRSIALSKRRMVEMATLDKETARSCNYALKRTDKNGKIVWIEGPSIRMAEIAVSCWGNVRYGARVISEDDRFITAQGVCHDLETNVMSTMEVRRRITTRNNKKFGDDMVGVTANAACAIAARNAVFKVIPRTIINEAASRAMDAAMGDAKTFGEVRAGIVSELQKMGATLEMIMVVLGKEGKGFEDIDSTDLRRLIGVRTSIKDGESTVAQIFSAGDAAKEPDQAAADLTDAFNKKAAPTTAVSPEATPVAETKSEPTAIAAATAEPAKIAESEKFWVNVFEVAESVGMDPEAVKKVVGRWAIASKPPLKGREHEATQEQKDQLFKTIGEWKK